MSSKRRRRGGPRKPQPPAQRIDHISALPDSLLVGILSFLPKTEDAVKTCVLSKRWLHLWTQLPNLVFRNRSETASKRLRNFRSETASKRLRNFRSETASKRLPNFSNFVNKTLSLHSARMTRVEFDLDALRVRQLGHLVGLWLRSVTVQPIEKLALDFSGPFDVPPDFDKDDLSMYAFSLAIDGGTSGRPEEYNVEYGYPLPPFLNAHASLRELKTKCCDFAPHDQFRWNLLRDLAIGFSKLTDEMVGNVLAGSPVLESLKLYTCVGISRLDIASQSLKKLVLSDIRQSVSGDGDNALLVWCPRVKFLEILGLWHRKCKLMNASSLVSANLDFFRWRHLSRGDNYMEGCRKMVMELLEMVSPVEELKIGGWCLTALSDLVVRSLPTPSLDCRSLVLNIINCLEARDLPATASLLENSSKLEKLVIHGFGHSGFWEFFGRYYYEVKNQMSLEKLIDSLSLSHLKTIEIHDLEAAEDEVELKLLKSLLKNAEVLEKLVVSGHGRLDADGEKNEMIKKLLSFPRSSPHAVVFIF